MEEWHTLPELGSKRPMATSKTEDDLGDIIPTLNEFFDEDEQNDQDDNNNQSRVPRPQYQCPLCSKTFTRNLNLQGHIRAHSQEKPFPCSHCSKTFTRAHDRNVHEHEVHTTGPAHRHICRDFVFKDKTGNSTKECKGCGKSFTRLTTLKRHQESIVHESLKDIEAIEGELEQLGQGVPLEAFSTWMRTGKTNDLRELRGSIAEAKNRRQQSR